MLPPALPSKEQWNNQFLVNPVIAGSMPALHSHALSRGRFTAWRLKPQAIPQTLPPTIKSHKLPEVKNWAQEQIYFRLLHSIPLASLPYASPREPPCACAPAPGDKLLCADGLDGGARLLWRRDKPALPMLPWARKKEPEIDPFVILSTVQGSVAPPQSLPSS